MLNVVLALALVVPPAPAVADGPCARPIGGLHEAVPLGGASEGLDFQSRCLKWEYSVQPKGEFLPPSARVLPVKAVRVNPVEHGRSEHDSFADALSRSIGLRPAEGVPFGTLPPAVR